MLFIHFSAKAGTSSVFSEEDGEGGSALCDLGEGGVKT